MIKELGKNERLMEADVVRLGNEWGVVIQRDFDKTEMVIKVFPSVEDAVNFIKGVIR